MNKAALILLSLGLGACTVGPDYQSPNTTFMDKWFSSTSVVVSQEPINTQWWNAFNDPLLTKYIEQSAINNKDVQIAIANISRARAVRRENVGALLPSLDGSADATRSKSSGANSSFNSGEIRNIYDAGFDASWELDIFGGNRREVEASDARLGMAWPPIIMLCSVRFPMLHETTMKHAARKNVSRLQNKMSILLKQTYDLVNTRMEIGERNSIRCFACER